MTTTEVDIIEEAVATTSAGFEGLSLSTAVLRALKDLGFEEPTPVQARAIPLLMEGRDVVAQALTGTGKTAAYGIPLAERLDPRYNQPQAIVLSPTRELAIQVAEHLSQVGRHRHLRFLPVYGGQPIERQLRALSRGVHGIVATPGRLMDHMRRGTVNLNSVRILVLDEADQMLAMGFQEDVEYVIANLPQGRQTALFSATMPQPILEIVKNYMHEPEMVRLSRPQALTVPAVEQVYYQVPFPRKFDALCRVMDARTSDRTMVFCATKRMVDEVVERLPAFGYSAQGLHGDINQAGRERVLKAFRDGRTDVLVATDVAARGLDIPDVSLVINFDIPPDPEYYVHRIGRTGRVGRGGAAITFINPREMRELQLIERVTGARIQRGELPLAVDREEQAAQQLEGRLRDMLTRDTWRKFRAVAADLALENDALDVAAAALALAAEHRHAPKRIGSVAASRAHDSVDAATSATPYRAPKGLEGRAPHVSPKYRPKSRRPGGAAPAYPKAGFRASRKARRAGDARPGGKPASKTYQG